jgi:hypothetical protein
VRSAGPASGDDHDAPGEHPDPAILAHLAYLLEAVLDADEDREARERCVVYLLGDLSALLKANSLGAKSQRGCAAEPRRFTRLLRQASPSSGPGSGLWPRLRCT